MDLERASDHFTAGVRVLAISRGSIQSRLCDALMLHVRHALTAAASSPDDRVRRIEAELRALATEWEATRDSHSQSQIAVWSISLSESRAVQLATWIVDSAGLLNAVRAEPPP